MPEKVRTYSHPQRDPHRKDREFRQMRKRIAIAYVIGGIFFAGGANAQTGALDPIKLKALQTQYEELAARYKKRCDLIDYDRDIDLLRIKQGAALAEGVVFPMTMQIVTVLENIQKQINDDMCDRAKDYSNLAETIGDILK